MPRLYLGTSGWSYDDWVGPFYPTGLPKRDFLTEYAKHFPAVEIDSTFYGIPRADSVKRWRDSTPAPFLFCAKFPKAITHEKALRDCDAEVAAFLKAMDGFGEKLGVLLLQFEYGFQATEFDNLAQFLQKLPSGHRYAVEVRNRKWLTPSFLELLRQHRIALTLVDHPWLPKLQEQTADFVYVRLLGDRNKIQEPFDKIQVDRDKDLRFWAEVIHKFVVREVPVFGFVNNHYSGHSPATTKLLDEFIQELVRKQDKSASP